MSYVNFRILDSMIGNGLQNIAWKFASIELNLAWTWIFQSLFLLQDVEAPTVAILLHFLLVFYWLMSRKCFLPKQVGRAVDSDGGFTQVYHLIHTMYCLYFQKSVCLWLKHLDLSAKQSLSWWIISHGVFHCSGQKGSGIDHS